MQESITQGPSANMASAALENQGGYTALKLVGHVSIIGSDEPRLHPELLLVLAQGSNLINLVFSLINQNRTNSEYP